VIAPLRVSPQATAAGGWSAPATATVSP